MSEHRDRERAREKRPNIKQSRSTRLNAIITCYWWFRAFLAGEFFSIRLKYEKRVFFSLFCIRAIHDAYIDCESSENQVKANAYKLWARAMHSGCFVSVCVCVCDRVCCDTDNMLIGCIMEMKRKRIAISAEERNVYAVNEWMNVHMQIVVRIAPTITVQSIIHNWVIISFC